MSRPNEDVQLVIEKLEKYGLQGEIIERGKHLEIAWQTPHGRRFVFASRTPSDWRSGMNNRSQVRKLLKADGLQPVSTSNLSFQKAMSLPKPVAVSHEQLLHKDVEALTDLLFELQDQVTVLQQRNAELIQKMESITVVSRIEFGGAKEQLSEANDLVVEVNRKITEKSFVSRLNKQQTVINMLTHQFSNVSDLIKEAGKLGITRAHTNQILQKARRQGLVENGLRGMWRRIDL